MRRHHLVFQAITSRDRHLVVRQVQDALTLARGWVDDAHFYSNKMTTIRFTLAAGDLPVFRTTLQEYGVMIEDVTRPGIGAGVASLPDDAEISGSLQITFLHNEPDLKQVIPAVPG
ncbi:hypothetical protein [Thalassospira sp. TSL5-1]|uniref:hypothetical protein n=1 Tax=Thalassospira sp. TSL5-1 TaxID=1544451 RepID=UPI000938E5BB|nr:hypothetical protein [Thalassospira sp. TSL5-1]OKH87268.1 hypothetical protein LF95_10565 [Thalassospira sp. TSL5-1]